MNIESPADFAVKAKTDIEYLGISARSAGERLPLELYYFFLKTKIKLDALYRLSFPLLISYLSIFFKAAK